MLDKHFKILLFDIAYLGRPMLVGKALSFTHELPYFFLSIHRSQQPRILEVRS